MVKLKFLFPIFLLVYTSALAQGQGKIIEYDFGQVLQSGSVQRKYVIKEKVKSAVSLCECIQIKVTPKDNSSLLEIEFNPSGYSGQTLQEIKLLDEKNNLITLRIKAYVINPGR